MKRNRIVSVLVEYEADSEEDSERYVNRFVELFEKSTETMCKNIKNEWEGRLKKASSEFNNQLTRNPEAMSKDDKKREVYMKSIEDRSRLFKVAVSAKASSPSSIDPADATAWTDVEGVLIKNKD